MKEKVYLDFSKILLPDVNDVETSPFWEGTRQGKIRFPKCKNCHQFQWYPCVLCPNCHSSNIEWQTITSMPRLYSWTCVRRPLGPHFAIWGPYIVAYVEFDEAPDLRLVSNLVDCRPEEVYIGMPLEAAFQHINDEVTIPLFKPMKEPVS